MTLWVDKYRPRKLSELTYHLEQADNLAKIVKAGDFPHLLVFGPNGAGKRTRINCILNELYGRGAERLKMDTKNFETPSGKKLEIQIMTSNYHIELCPGDVGIYDRFVIQEVIKQMAQMKQIDADSQRSFKVVLLMEVDQLSRDAQHALRRTMEKYAATCRLILCCESASKVIDPVRSRCMAIRVPCPSDSVVEKTIKDVCAKEKVTIPDAFAQTIAKNARGNMRRALLMVEAAKAQSYPFQENQKPPDPEWEIFLQETARIILQQQTPDNLLKVRGRIYECLGRCIPANIIFVKLVESLLQYCDGAIKAEVISEAALHEHQLTKGSKAIFHIEAFVAAFMDIYHHHLSENPMET